MTSDEETALLQKKRRAVGYLRNGAWREADELIFEILEQQPQWLRVNSTTPIDQELYRILEYSENTESIFAAYRVGHFLFHGRRMSDARKWFTRAVRLAQKQPKARYILEASLNFLLIANFEISRPNLIAENVDILREWATHFRDRNWFAISSASVAFLNNQDKIAVDHIQDARGARSSSPIDLIKSQKSIDCVLPWEEIVNISEVGGHSTDVSMEFDARFAAEDGATVHLSASDARYFRDFSEAFVRSAASIQFRDLIHFRIVDACEQCMSLIESYRRQYPNVKINYSYSVYNNKINARAYFATARFLFAPQIMQMYRCNLIITDIDVSVCQNASCFSTQIGDFSFGVRLRPVRNYLPWKYVVVNQVFVSNSEEARSAFGYINKYFTKVISDPTRLDTWGVDQAAFYYCLYGGLFPNLRICNLNVAGIPKYVNFADADKHAWAAELKRRIQA